jgi:hypothetical protein
MEQFLVFQFGTAIVYAFPSYIAPAFFRRSLTGALFVGAISANVLVALELYITTGTPIEKPAILPITSAFFATLLGLLSGLLWYAIHKFVYPQKSKSS